MKDYIEDKILQKIELIEDSSNYSRVIPTKVVDGMCDALSEYGSGYFRLYFNASKNPYGDGYYHSLFSSYLLKNNMVSDSSMECTIYLSISEANIS